MWLWIATRKGKEFRAKHVTCLSVVNRDETFYIEYCKRGTKDPDKILCRDQVTVKFGPEKSFENEEMS